MAAGLPPVPNGELVDERRWGTRPLIRWMNDLLTWASQGLWRGPNTVAATPISNDGTTPALEAGEEWNVTGNGTRTPNSIYDAIYPGITHYDVVAAVLDAPNGGTTIHTTALGGYVYNDNPSTGLGPNGVALFGIGLSTRSNCATWGINTLVQDNPTRAVGALTGQYAIGAEFDLNIMNTGTSTIGVSVGGNGLSQPTNANAFIINSLGTGLYWTGGLVSYDGSCQYAISFGALSAAGASVNGQYMAFASYDSGGGAATHVMQAQSGAMVHTGRGLVVGNSVLATNTTTGFLYLPTCAGAPSGSPVAFTGTSPAIVDTTNLRIYCNIAGTWRYAQLT